jgi:hypothetical protein
MKLIKAILTSITFTVTFVIVLLAEYFTLAIITLPGTLPGSNTNIVDRVHLLPDLSDQSEISYYDAVEFWRVDFQESINLASETPEYNIRGWIDQSWWYENTVWADSALSYIKAIIVPAVSPVYEIKELYVYYGTSLVDFEGKFNYTENGVIQFVLYGNVIGDQKEITNPTPATIAAQIQKVKNEQQGFTRNHYQFIFNLQRKIQKYNSPEYTKFVEKFIDYTGDLYGVRGIDYEFLSVKGLSAFLFHQIFLAIVLAAYFTYQNPIVITRNSEGENEVQGRFLPRVPKIGLGKRDKKNKESKGA